MRESIASRYSFLPGRRRRGPVSLLVSFLVSWVVSFPAVILPACLFRLVFSSSHPASPAIVSSVVLFLPSRMSSRCLPLVACLFVPLLSFLFALAVFAIVRRLRLHAAPRRMGTETMR